MDTKRKRVLLFLGSMLVAVMFLTGAAGLGGGGVPSSGNSSPTHTLNITMSKIPLYGTANATIYSYGSSIKLTLNNNTYANNTASILTSMENNGSITTYAQVSKVFDISAGKYDAYKIYTELLKSLGNTTFSFSSLEYIKLPAFITLATGNRSTPVNTSLAPKYQIYANISPPNSTMKVKVAAIPGILNNEFVLVPGNVTITKV